MNFQRAISSYGVTKKLNGHEEIVRKNGITVVNGNRAVVITAPRNEGAKEVLDALEIQSPSEIARCGRVALFHVDRVPEKLRHELCRTLHG